MGLILDPQLVRDLTLLVTASGVGGMIMEVVKQPVINGYFIAGSFVGPGGLKVIKVSNRLEEKARSTNLGSPQIYVYFKHCKNPAASH